MKTRKLYVFSIFTWRYCNDLSLYRYVFLMELVIQNCKKLDNAIFAIDSFILMLLFTSLSGFFRHGLRRIIIYCYKEMPSKECCHSPFSVKYHIQLAAFWNCSSCIVIASDGATFVIVCFYFFVISVFLVICRFLFLFSSWFGLVGLYFMLIFLITSSSM